VEDRAIPGTGKFEALTRIGFAARGVIYGLMGYLALKSGRTEDGGGVLAWLASGSGLILLAVMAAGLLAYGLWRLTEAWIDSAGRGTDAKGMAERGGGAISGLVHLGLAGVAALHVIGSGGGGGGDSAEAGARTALDLPGGGVVLVLVAAALLVTGLVQLGKAWTLDFLKHLGCSGDTRLWVGRLGRGGFLARGIVFLIMAWSFWRAGSEGSSSQAGGPAEALSSLPGTLQTLVAAGLLLFGLFSFAEAWFRRIADPNVAARLRSLGG
jgi:hypothetical protein